MSGEQEQNPGEVLQQLPLAVSMYEPSLFVKEQVAVNQIVSVNYSNPSSQYAGKFISIFFLILFL